MRRGRVGRSLGVLISLLISTTISSTGCSTLHSSVVECKRPNLIQKTSWKLLAKTYREDPTFGPGVRWISEILEEDCFADEAEEARQQDGG